MKVKKPKMLIRKDKKTGKTIGAISLQDFLKYSDEITKTKGIG